MPTARTVLVIGATGQVGRLVVDEALSLGLSVHALTRSLSRTRQFPAGVDVLEGSPLDPILLDSALEGVDLVVFTLGGDHDVEGVFYASTLMLLRALTTRPHIRLAFMTSMSISHSKNDHWAWKRRAERLVRASGIHYTIVRPGWFDYQGPDDTRIDLRQGDRVGGTPGADRRHIAQVLLHGALEASGAARTVEVFSGRGAPITDFEAMFAGSVPDLESARGALDEDLVPLAEEPARLRSDLLEFNARPPRA